jgi:hypothetical protein
MDVHALTGRSLGSYRLEEKLETARREALSLARAIGQAEGDRDRVAALLAAPRPGFLSRLLGRGSR